MEEESASRKRKKLINDNIVRTFDERAKKQCKTSRVQEACCCNKHHGYLCFIHQSSEAECCLHPSREMSLKQQHLNGPFPKSFTRRIQCTTCGRRSHHFEVCPKKDIVCYHCEQYGHYSNRCPMKKLDPSELGFLLFKRQVEDETLSEAMSYCSIDGSHASLENESQPFGHMSRSGQQNSQCMTLFTSPAFLSIMQLSYRFVEAQTPLLREFVINVDKRDNM